ncbi:hypothetical protein LTR62_001428 [Meristemomyces frigidus]|uniref:NAD(P)-binding protein n=1 Tax=Meristemomyces frigidus TaxID=1508187 RepID=A0AAN7TK48_9PEZI|nr:hypothetical protein LTR62_001428 [Meristemomyces frigidus]
MATMILNTALNPVVTVPAYLLITQAPANIRDPILSHLRQYLSPSVLAIAMTTLKYTSLLGLYRQATAFLSDWAQNNYRLSSERHRYDWPKEIAVVTGGTGGFGSLICKALASKGLIVLCVDITPSMPEAMANNPRIKYEKCDITNPDAVKELGSRVQKTYGHPSILVNNAGIGLNHTILAATPTELRKIYDINLLSHYYLLQQFLPSMISDKKGHVVSMASMASFVTQAGMSSYCGTKAALLCLHEALLQETRVLHDAPEVKFSIVHPTFADTPLYRQFKNEIDAGGPVVLRPEVVSEAVVRQILACKSGQVVLGGGMGWLSGLRGWPQWVQQGFMHVSDGSVRKGMEVGKVSSKVVA